MKQKKLYEGQISQLQQQTFNMEQASLTTENLRNTMATVDAMKTANKEMRKQYGKIDIDKIEVRSWLSLGRGPFTITSLPGAFAPVCLASWPRRCLCPLGFSATAHFAFSPRFFRAQPAALTPFPTRIASLFTNPRSSQAPLPQIPLIPVLCARFPVTDANPLPRSKCNTTWRT